VICSDECRVELGKDNRVLIWLHFPEWAFSVRFYNPIKLSSVPGCQQRWPTLFSTVPRCLKCFITPYIVGSGCPVKRVQLSSSEKNAIYALHKAGLKGPTIARETGHPLPTIYGVIKHFRQRGTVENKVGHLC
jgi:hypothetical protein